MLFLVIIPFLLPLTAIAQPAPDIDVACLNLFYEPGKQLPKVGMSASITRTFTADDILQGTLLTGDENPIHTDSSYATDMGLPGPIIHGFTLIGFVSRLIAEKLPGPGSMASGLNNVEFLRPVFPGDTLTATANITEVRTNSRTNTIFMTASVINQNGKVVLRGDLNVRYQPR